MPRGQMLRSFAHWSRRRGLRLTLALAACALAISVGSTVLGDSVINSKHNFSSTGTAGPFGSSRTTEVCVFCHTPHNATAGAALWNRNLATSTFTLYSSPSLNATMNQPGTYSLICLSCHDGSVAVDAFVRGRTWDPPELPAIGDIYYPGGIAGMSMNIGGNYTGNPNVNDLSNDHPVSFDYNAALVAADGRLQNPASIALPLPSGRVECTTCHNAHDNQYKKFLRASNAQSALCTTCHIK